MNHTGGVLAIAVGLLSALSGCGGASVDERGQRVAVAGKVLLDGSPLSRARILFVSDEGAGAVKASALIDEGAFAIDAGHGPLAGTARVEIHPELIELEELESVRGGDHRQFVETQTAPIPTRYNHASELTAIVAVDGENEFTFELTSR